MASQKKSSIPIKKREEAIERLHLISKYLELKAQKNSPEKLEAAIQAEKKKISRKKQIERAKKRARAEALLEKIAHSIEFNPTFRSEPDLNPPIKITNLPNSYDCHIVWSLWDKCNYRCSYCTPWNYLGKHADILNLEKTKKIVDLLHTHYVERLKKKNIQISFSGGEPTLFKGFKDLCQYILQKGFYLGITSNGSMGTHYWNNFAHQFETISISFHPEYADSDKTLELLKILDENEKVVTPAVRIMMHPDPLLWKKCINLAKKIKSELNNWTIEYTKIQNDFGLDMTPAYYSKKQSLFLEENAFHSKIGNKNLERPPKVLHSNQIEYQDHTVERIRPNLLLNQDRAYFQNWICSAGLESLYIDALANVYRAGCRIGGTLGNLLALNSVKLPIQPVQCPFSKCTCQADIVISKTKSTPPSL